MNKQSKTVYTALMNRIGIVLLINQGLIAVLGTVLSLLETGLAVALGDSRTLDAAILIGECAVYFLSFAIPVNIFNKMNKNASVEIYIPRESEALGAFPTVLAMGIALGGTLLSAYLNFFLVDAWGYSEFSSDFLWSVELEHPYQIVIYLAYSVLIPAVVEEYLFRGTVCKSLTPYGNGTAIIISAILFALMHSNVEQLLYTFVAGLLFAWVYTETKNIALPIALHLINNGVAAVGDIVSYKHGQGAKELYFAYTDTVIIAFAIISLVGFCIYAYKKKRRAISPFVLKPDENGNEVLPLSVRERASGFFCVGIALFAIYSLFTMISLIIMSVKL